MMRAWRDLDDDVADAFFRGYSTFGFVSFIGVSIDTALTRHYTVIELLDSDVLANDVLLDYYQVFYKYMLQEHLLLLMSIMIILLLLLLVIVAYLLIELVTFIGSCLYYREDDGVRVNHTFKFTHFLVNWFYNPCARRYRAYFSKPEYINLDYEDDEKQLNPVTVTTDGVTYTFNSQPLNPKPFRFECAVKGSPIINSDRHPSACYITDDTGLVLGGGWRYGNYVLTAVHVMLSGAHSVCTSSTNCISIPLIRSNKKFEEFNGTDLAYFRLTEQQYSVLGLKKLNISSTAMPSVNDTIYVWAYYGNKWCRTRGHILEALTYPDFCHSATTEPGYSGCIITNGTKVIGFHRGVQERDGVKVNIGSVCKPFAFRLDSFEFNPATFEPSTDVFVGENNKPNHSYIEANKMFADEFLEEKLTSEQFKRLRSNPDFEYEPEDWEPGFGQRQAFLDTYTRGDGYEDDLRGSMTPGEMYEYLITGSYDNANPTIRRALKDFYGENAPKQEPTAPVLEIADEISDSIEEPKQDFVHGLSQEAKLLIQPVKKILQKQPDVLPPTCAACESSKPTPESIDRSAKLRLVKQERNLQVNLPKDLSKSAYKRLKKAWERMLLEESLISEILPQAQKSRKKLI
jgi:hypothetical protein